MTCRGCGEDKPVKEFAKNSSRGRPIRTRCKLCVAEQAKFSTREYKELPKLAADLPKWPDVKLASEIAWRERQLGILMNEARRRRRIAGSLRPPKARE